MSLVHQCAAPDCHVVTMGAFCIDHEREALASSHDDALEQISNAAEHSRDRATRSARALPLSLYSAATYR
jgi:hypothetical protein